MTEIDPEYLALKVAIDDAREELIEQARAVIRRANTEAVHIAHV